MRIRFINSAIGIAFIALISSCTVFDRNLSASGIVTVDAVSSAGGFIEQVSVTQRGTTTWITAPISWRWPSRGVIPTTVIG